MLFARCTLHLALCTLALCTLALCTAPMCKAGTSASKQKKELQRLRTSIEQTKKKISELSNQERRKNQTIASYQRQRHAVAVFIAQLEGELERLQDSVVALNTQIQETQLSLDSAESAYNRAANNLVKWKSENRGMLSNSYRYDAVFRRMTAAVAGYRADMIELRDSLESQEDLLQAYTSTQQGVLSTKSQQERQLKATISKSSQELKKIRSNKTELIKQLEAKKKSANQLRGIIAQQIELERKRAEAERRKVEQSKNRKQRSEAKRGDAGPSESVRGFPANSLPWPTRSHNVMIGYGMYKEPKTGTTLENPGIDIASKIGSSVSAVAEGKVSSIAFLPGFGSLVIVDHGNGVRTVYANLASVSVQKGSAVKAGTIVGTNGENIDGELLHFELWNGRNRQNPLTYLR